MAQKVKVKGYKVKSYSRSMPKDSRKKVGGRYIKTATGKKEFIPARRKFYIVGRKTSPAQAENAIRDMFLSRQYNKIIPVEDINIRFEKAQRFMTKDEKAILKKVFRTLLKEKYIIKKGKNYIWQG